MKLISAPSLVMFAIAFVVGRQFSRPPTKWQEGEKWETFFSIYDDIAAKQFRECESRLLPTKFGDTRVYACGSAEDPAALLFHGAADCSLMYGEWLVPKLLESHYTVMVDTLCDMGRSRPADGDISNCPQTEEELADWAKELFTQLNIQKASLIGYSYGSFIATRIALHAPTLVDKLVLLAPAGVFAPIETAWIARAMIFSMLYSLLEWQPACANALRNWFFNYMTTGDYAAQHEKFNPELGAAADAAGTAQLPVYPVASTVEILTEMNERNPTLLIVGENETVIDAEVAIRTAKKAGIQVKSYPNASHMLNEEHPRYDIVDVVASFVDSDSR